MRLDYRQLDLATFINDARRLRRRLFVVPFVLAAMYFVPLLLAVPFRDTVRAWVQAAVQSGYRPWFAVAGFAWVALALVAAGLVERQIRRDPRVRCPSCGGSLLRHSAVTIATGKCGHCGSRVLSDDAPPQ
jgi:DNA-directed RNA polymerase subunit RPC12/RpoP